MDGSVGRDGHYCIGLGLRTFGDTHWDTSQGLRAYRLPAAHYYPALCDWTCSYPVVRASRCGERLSGVGLRYSANPLALRTYGHSDSTDFGIHTDCFPSVDRSSGGSKPVYGRGCANPAGFTLANLLDRLPAVDASRTG